MNLEQLNAMSDAELNELSAVKVMKFPYSFNYYIDANNSHFIIEEGQDNGGRILFRGYQDSNGNWLNSWNPTTDMNDAMELLTALHNHNWILHRLNHQIDAEGKGLFNRFRCTLLQVETGASREFTDGNSFSRAITIASILAKEETQ